MCSSVALGAFILLCNQSWELFSSCKTGTLVPLSSSFYFSSHQLLAAFIVCSVSMNVTTLIPHKASMVTHLVKNLPAMQETVCNAGDLGSIPGLGRSPGEGNGNPLQYSCLGNPLDRGACWAAVHGVTRVRHDLATKPQQPPPGTS